MYKMYSPIAFGLIEFLTLAGRKLCLAGENTTYKTYLMTFKIAVNPAFGEMVFDGYLHDSLEKC